MVNREVKVGQPRVKALSPFEQLQLLNPTLRKPTVFKEYPKLSIMSERASETAKQKESVSEP